MKTQQTQQSPTGYVKTMASTCIASALLCVLVGCSTAGNRQQIHAEQSLIVITIPGSAATHKRTGTLDAAAGNGNEVSPTANVSDNAVNTGDSAKTTAQGQTDVKPSKTSTQQAPKAEQEATKTYSLSELIDAFKRFIEKPEDAKAASEKEEPATDAVKAETEAAQ